MGWRVVNLRKLDDGGNGDVYIGERSDTGETVVVKYLRDHENVANRRWFAREIRILAKRLHRSLVPFLGGDAEAKQPYYIMPYLSGGSLTKWCGRLTEAQLRTCAIQIGEAVAALHGDNTAHGDVKPDNILLTKDGSLQVGDPLGNGGGCTVLYTVNSGGTPGYWAPEVMQGGPISLAGDVFSFGATLFHLATGRRPVDGQNLDPWESGAAIPSDMHAVVVACVKRNPGERPTMAQVVTSLKNKQAPASPASATPKSPVGELIGAALTLLAVVAGAALLGNMDKGSKK
jgi:serine/threonine protein kinase